MRKMIFLAACAAIMLVSPAYAGCEHPLAKACVSKLRAVGFDARCERGQITAPVSQSSDARSAQMRLCRGIGVIGSAE